jgi:hypothetical protein
MDVAIMASSNQTHNSASSPVSGSGSPISTNLPITNVPLLSANGKELPMKQLMQKFF